jgi:SAM-dependent methyltransferase
MLTFKLRLYTKEMAEFWEEAFRQKGEMWGWQPAKSAVLANELFLAGGVKSVLVPGIGYGRNARVFRDSGIAVTGIEVSGTAVDLAKRYFGDALKIYHGSVTEMPFDDRLYDAVFCYALIHLLDKKERVKLIADCYDQLAENGLMVFTAVTKQAAIYREGTYVSQDRFEVFDGIKMFYYDVQTIAEEFGKAGLFGITEITESYPFYLIRCKKEKAGGL